MKKFMNQPADFYRDSLQGFALAHAERITLHTDPVFVTSSTPLLPNTVAVISGGGTGHEPLHAGFIGHGMLQAAIPGEVFTSPTPDQVAAAITKVDSGAGVLSIIKNYTGDVLNFELGMEFAQAQGHNCTRIIVADDIAVPADAPGPGRRGVAGTIIVEKIAGAAAARGDDLDTVTDLAQRTAARIRTLGVALAPSTSPTVGRPGFDLADSEIELGIGIHGEPGITRMEHVSATELVTDMLQRLSDELPREPGDTLVLLVNGMGGTPLAELYLLFQQCHKWFSDRGQKIGRHLVGNYVTALDMQGASLTIASLDAQMLSLWDAPVDAIALQWG